MTISIADPAGTEAALCGGETVTKTKRGEEDGPCKRCILAMPASPLLEYPMTTKTVAFENVNTISASNNFAHAPSLGTGPGPVTSSVSNTSLGHEPHTVTKNGSSRTKTKRNLDTDSKIPRSHALQKGVNPNPVGFYSEMCHSQILSQSRPLKDGGKSAVRGKSAAYDIVAELARKKSHCNHLDAPSPAVAHYGPEPEDLIDWYVDLQRKARLQTEQKVRDGEIHSVKQRKSTAIIMVALASYPGSPDHNDARYVEWLELNVEFAKRRYGKNLVGIYEHTDEPHGHLHILVANEGKPIKPLMAGDGAFKKTLDAGGSRAEAGAAKNLANSALLDDYYEHVNAPIGIARKNKTPRARMSWKAAKVGQLKEVESFQDEERARIKAASMKNADKIMANEAESLRLFKEKHRLIEEKSVLKYEARRREQSLEQRAEKVVGREKDLDHREARLGDVEEKLSKMQRALDTLMEFLPDSLKAAAKSALDATRAAVAKIKPK